MVDTHERALRSAIGDPDAVQLVFETANIVEDLIVDRVVCVACIKDSLFVIVDLDGVVAAFAADDAVQINTTADEVEGCAGSSRGGDVRAFVRARACFQVANIGSPL